MLRPLKKKLIFFAGDIRRERCLGGFAWGKFERLVDFDEAAEALNHVSPGYVGLHRNRGDLSNVAISGFMKHAWLHSGPSSITEAVSEGVLYRHAYHALMSDYVIALKPLVPLSALDEAVNRVTNIIGCPYDDTFTFDLEIEDRMFADKETAISNMREYGLGVSCTEMVALGFVGHRRELGLFRTKTAGRQAILPDAYLTTHFQIVWASKHATPETAARLGLHEEGCSMLSEYWKSRHA